MKTENLESGMRVKTRGGQVVNLFTVRHFNDTVSIGITREQPILVSADEIAEVIEEAE